MRKIEGDFVKNVIAYGAIADEEFVRVVAGYAVITDSIETATRFDSSVAAQDFIDNLDTAKNNTGALTSAWTICDVDVTAYVTASV